MDNVRNKWEIDYFQYLTNESKAKIANLLESINKLSKVEQLCLYVNMPPKSKDLAWKRSGPLKDGANLYREFEIKMDAARRWIDTHFDEAKPGSAFKKKNLFETYKSWCKRQGCLAVCQADFGKAMMQTKPNVIRRRLGERGKSYYCYANLEPIEFIEPPTDPRASFGEALDQGHQLIDHLYAEQPVASCSFSTNEYMSQYHDTSSQTIREPSANEYSVPATAAAFAVESFPKQQSLQGSFKEEAYVSGYELPMTLSCDQQSQSLTENELQTNATSDFTLHQAYSSSVLSNQLLGQQNMIGHCKCSECCGYLTQNSYQQVCL